MMAKNTMPAMSRKANIKLHKLLLGGLDSSFSDREESRDSLVEIVSRAREEVTFSSFRTEFIFSPLIRIFATCCVFLLGLDCTGERAVKPLLSEQRLVSAGVKQLSSSNVAAESVSQGSIHTTMLSARSDSALNRLANEDSEATLD